ncbi:LNS2 domain-containing protein [Oceanirhabdus sp. W0125-5]|uniref:LNS2 domain-containing protein n=1 Tax=Oceanirhabdus sp. W0125-5 TaxID=2999116 RepID=UPI0022F32864|nr:HAD family acid phosphatase [Oceanirhabdus sp. W0125-5]WBW94684.1 HAD family acid phosphatase [Oceanirhabdus sp. W0125-5]
MELLPYNNNAFIAHDYFYNLIPQKFPDIKKTYFRHWYNTLFTSSHKSHHNGFDLIVTEKDTILIRGKFHYGDFRKDLEDEWVSIFMYDFNSPDSSWIYITRILTDNDGHIFYHLPEETKLKKGLYLIKFVVEGDCTTADMYIKIIKEKEDYVIFDIDGTLTISDKELIKESFYEFLDVNYKPKAYIDSYNVVNFYKDKGYNILYLTARPSWLISNTLKWLKENNFPFGILHTNETAIPSSYADIYKSIYLKSIVAKGVTIESFYGNALTDISAYISLDISPESIYIIGEHAGKSGTTPISNYTDHLCKLISENKKRFL